MTGIAFTTPSVSPAATARAPSMAACQARSISEAIHPVTAGLLAVALVVTLQQHVGVVAERPCKLGDVACLAAESQSILEVGLGVVKVARRLGEKAQETVVADA